MAIIIPVEDRVSTYPGRIKLTPVSGQTNVYDMSRADEPVSDGTPLNKALLDQKAYTLTEDTVVHVSPYGSDADGDGSTVTPFATIQGALNALPRILGGHTATIDIAEGTYEERINVTGFSGGNLIIGQIGRNVMIRGIVVSGSSHVTVNIPNITWVDGFSGAIFLVTHDSVVALGSDMTVNAGGSSNVGIDVTHSSELIGTESVVTVKNCARTAIHVTNGSQAAFYSIAGNNNTERGLVVENGGVISYTSLNLTSALGNAGAGSGTYIHNGGNLIGCGENGKFKATVSGTISTINVNGVNCAVKCGEDSEMDLVAGCWYTFILDGNTVNFNSGGAGSGGSTMVIVGSTTRPAKATQNMIWIDTDVEITSYVLSGTEPENPTSGMVWVTISNSGRVATKNPIGGNWMTMYLLRANQHIDGAWVKKTVMCYQDGEWLNCLMHVYKNGVTTHNILAKAMKTGADAANPAVAPTVSVHETNFEATLGSSSSGAAGIVYLSDKVDLSNVSTLYVKGTFKSGNNAAFPYVGVWSDIGTYSSDYRVTMMRPCEAADTTIETTAAVDVSGLPNGLYYIGFVMSTATNKTCTINIEEIYYE